MPVIGEIKRAKEINRGNGRIKYIWTACKKCGKERWVYLRKGIAGSSFCKKCGYRPHHQKGDRNSNWKGGRVFTNTGYVKIKLQPDNFFFLMTKKDHYVLEHRLVMAKHLGRCLQIWEIVHHKGTKYPKGSKEDKGDNRIENLQLITDDRHRQITILENRISYLEKRITLLEVENIRLQVYER